MEPVTAPLRLISRKFLRPTSLDKPVFKKHTIRQKWLTPTLSPRGDVLPEFRPLLGALQATHRKTSEIQEFRAALKAQNYTKAADLWSSVRNVNADLDFVPSWKDLTLQHPHAGSYGPQILVNALNDIAQHNRHNKSLVKTLVSPSGSTLDPYILGYVTTKIAKWDLPMAIELLSHPGWSETARNLGLVALLDVDILSVSQLKDDLLKGHHLPNRLIAKVCAIEESSSKAFVDLFELLAQNQMLPPSKPVDKLLRLVYTSSDLGSLAVRKFAMEQKRPYSFYPFIVKRLCEKVVLGDEEARRQLDFLFDHRIADMANDKPGLVLYLLVMRIIATDGVQATSSVLNRWVESDPQGVNEHTWMLLFQAFRRMGRPDKCNEVLYRIMKTDCKLSMPFVGEYLIYTAQFFNLQEYVFRTNRVLPEMAPVFEVLGISEFIESLPMSQEKVMPISPSNLALHAENREFFVGRIHESWLNITYQAVLAHVESSETALQLFEKYTAYASDTPVSLRVVDQFVALLCTLPDGDIDAAEHVYREAFEKLRIKRPVDGKNHSKSLEALTHKLLLRQDIGRAVHLLVFARQHGQTITHATVKGWIDRLPTPTKMKLTQWLDDAGVVFH